MFRQLLSRLHDWYIAWKPPHECAPSTSPPPQPIPNAPQPSLGVIFVLDYTQAFQTRLFACLPPSFALGLKHLAGWCLSPESYPAMVSRNGAQIDMSKVWTNIDVLGLLDRYESVISSAAFESIEKKVAEMCPGRWDQRMLSDLRLWMSQTVVQWLLKVFVRSTDPSESVSVWTGPA